MKTAIDRARAYIAKMPDAVAGQNGHGATFNVARVLLHFFELNREDAAKLLDEYNGRCAPAWSAKELNHKLNSAAKSNWEGPRAKDNDRLRQGNTGKTGKASVETRTLRMGFAKSVSAASAEIYQSRTLRMDFLDNYIMCAQAHTHEAVGTCSENPSESSGAESDSKRERNITQPRADTSLPSGEAAAGEINQVLKLVHTDQSVARDTSQGFATWVKRDGASFRAEVRPGEIRIGRQLGRGGGEVKR